jgi:pilus assembly protein CpaF
MTLDDLVRRGMLEGPQADLLVEHVGRRTTIAISGGTGTGKTTLLNALLGHVGHAERVVTVEETPELRPGCAHRVSLVARQPNVEGHGGVALDVLVKAALRMRPDRIVVGEVRGREALSALTAMSTGHAGSMLTLHAASAREAPDRMVSLCLEGGPGPGEGTLRRQVGQVFGLIVHLERRDGSRKLTELHVADEA